MFVLMQMDNLQELFSYQTVPASCATVHSSAGPTHSTGPAQLQVQVQPQTVPYANLTTCSSATCTPKESVIYATASPAPNTTSTSIQQNPVNVQHFNYDPNTQWISMPVIPAGPAPQAAHIQQVQATQHVGQPTQTIQIQTATPATVQSLNGMHGVNVQRAQTVATYQQPSGETINVAIIQPLFIVNDQQGIIQQLEPLHAHSAGPSTTLATATPGTPATAAAPGISQQPQPQGAQITLTHPSVPVTAIDTMVFPTPPPTATLTMATEPNPVTAELPITPVVVPTPLAEKPKRKPRRPPELIKAQREEYERQKIERHSVKPPCNCKFRCFEKLSEARRIEINRQYWQLPYDKQRDFILHSVEILDVKRRKKRKPKANQPDPQTGDADAGARNASDTHNTRKIQTIRVRDSEECKKDMEVVYVQVGEDGTLKKVELQRSISPHRTAATEPGKKSERRGRFSDDGADINRNDETEETSVDCVDIKDDCAQDSSATDGQQKFRRGWTRVYSLKGDNGKFLTVCKAMFLTTLGFPEKVDGALRFLNKQQKGDIRARSPQRGKATPMKGTTAKIDREVIKSHILSYKPVVVGRKKGQIRYLPGDMSIKKMHTDFKSRYTERNVSYTIYSEVFRSLNIVFRKDAKLS
ncbi:hypothetical protein BIW11_10996 [Tropilaelaps mercedesae]|uniref:Uncharacterized protein n=1 Tax=Tropilaelaps mercedesae TaxID=418985 RepID=A0A1V9XDG6_9ACAR|nr:hypothetical protein BIW11_10996 [Tropilaelaps mercedesae]